MGLYERIRLGVGVRGALGLGRLSLWTMGLDQPTRLGLDRRRRLGAIVGRVVLRRGICRLDADASRSILARYLLLRDIRLRVAALLLTRGVRIGDLFRQPARFCPRHGAFAECDGRARVNVTSYTRVGGAISNRSIDIAKLQAATGQPITPIRVVQAKGPVAAGAGRGPLQELRIYRPSVAAMKPPRLDDGKTPGPALDPDSKGVLLSTGPLDGGAVRAPSLDRPAESLSPPSLGGVTNPSLGVGNPGGGVLGGARGRLGR
jgi:hypothetical protein